MEKQQSPTDKGLKMEELKKTESSPAKALTDEDQSSQHDEGTSTPHMTIDDIIKIIEPGSSQTATGFLASGHFPRFKDLEEKNLKHLQNKLLRQSPPYNMQELGDTLHQYSKSC